MSKSPLPDKLQTSLQDNIAAIRTLFADVDAVHYRDIENRGHSFCLIYGDGLVNSDRLDAHVLRPLMLTDQLPPVGQGDTPQLLETIIRQVVPVSGIRQVNDWDSIVASLTYGDALLLVNSVPVGLILDVKGFNLRANTEPDSERILSGPREGFSEALLSNLALLRRKIRSQEMKVKYRVLGEQTRTQIAVVYMEDLINKEILQELNQRLERIHMDGILDANYITEMIRDNTWSAFRTIGYTERPDVVAAKLLEGRIAVFVDGTPVVLTVPYLFVENFQSNEDYYLSFYYTSFSRALRMVGLLLSITVPALYIAIISYHHEMLPLPLMINIAKDSHNVPLPAAFECMLLLLMFDILRETGIRMPSPIGQALSILGALVVGQAAVEAELVAAPMIIVVAVSGITSLLIPKMNASLIFMRLFLLVLGSTLGFLGLVLGLSYLLIRVLSLESFGISQVARDEHFQYQEIKDTFIRAPWWQMRTRRPVLSANQTRMRHKTWKELP